MKQEINDILTKAAKAGGEILKKYFETELEINTKSSPGDYVTKADLESQVVIVKTLEKLMIEAGVPKNEIGFIGEESLNRQAKHTFIIDPLDGTSFFMFGEEIFTVSIAYAENKIIKAGIVYQPTRNFWYFAEKGLGCFLHKKGKKIKLQIKYVPLSKSNVSLNIGSHLEGMQKILKIAYNLAPHVVRIRERGCISLSGSDLTLNNYNSFIHASAYLWDLAAVKIILEEAGGTMCDWQGKDIDINWDEPNKKYELLLGEKELIKEMLPYFKYE
jgi:myo-inositol-1(or 4)-monophosphatase